MLVNAESNILISFADFSFIVESVNQDVSVMFAFASREYPTSDIYEIWHNRHCIDDPDFNVSYTCYGPS